MSALFSIRQEPSCKVADTRALQCMSSSGMPRPELSKRERKLRIAKAVYFCKINNLDPTTYRLRNLTGLSPATLKDYFTGTKKIVDLYINNKIPLAQVPYKLYIGPLETVFYYPPTFIFTKYELLNGSLGYRLNSLDAFVIQGKMLKTNSPSGTFTLLTAQLLKEYGLIHPLTSFNTAVNISASTIKLLWATTLQNGRVYHRNSALIYLDRYDKHNRIVHKSENKKCDGLFYRDSHTGSIATGSFKYHLSVRGETFMRDLVARYMDLVLGETKLYIKPVDLLVSKEDIGKLSTRDQVVLLSRCAGTKVGKLHIVNDIKDTQDSRVYGLMTMLTSRARTTLGYHQYDMTAALQSIVFDVLDAKAPYDATKRFPVHFRMLPDRKTFRQVIANETGKDTLWVKISLTKIDNGGSVDHRILSKSDTLMKYKDEAKLFADEFMKYVDKEIVKTAKRHTKPHNIENEYIKKLIGKKYHEDGRKIFGLFFFAWTQIERDIRELMKPHFKGYCHDVHDAIASKEIVDVELLNQEIADAGFKYVKIEL